MSYETQTKADEYIDIMCGVSSGFDEETLHNEFAWLVHAREMLIDAIKSHTK
jgi:hypothetical protein